MYLKKTSKRKKEKILDIFDNAEHKKDQNLPLLIKLQKFWVFLVIENSSEEY